MNETLINLVWAYRTTQAKTLQSPTKYSGITYGDHSGTTVLRKDVEAMPMASLLTTFRHASEEKFAFGSDRLYLKYRGKATCDKVGQELAAQVAMETKSLREQLVWKASSPDQLKLMRNTQLNMAGKIPKYFMHDSWAKRVSSWET